MLVPFILLGAATAAGARGDAAAGQDGGVAGAALEALRGYPKQARAIIAPPRGDPSDPAALVVLASIALDEGDLREAARLVARLRAAAPSTTEARLLDALVNERRAQPRGDWIAAALASVEKVQPLAVSKPLVAAWDGRPLPFPEEAAAKLSASDRFLARWAWPQPDKDQVLLREAVQLGVADERPLVLLAALDVLTSAKQISMEGTPEPSLGAARSAVLAKLRDTPAGRFRFVTLPPKTDAQPVDDAEVAAIDASVAADSPFFASHYTEFLRILENLDPARGAVIAQNAAVKLQLPPTALLTIMERSALGKLSDAERDRLAAAFIRYAERLQREGLLITDLMGAIFLGNASELRKDPSLRARAEAVRPAVDALRSVAECLAPMNNLPVRSIQRALAEQKPQERAFLQQVALRGLSCPEPKGQR
jgi:hypothetical protein